MHAPAVPFLTGLYYAYAQAGTDCLSNETLDAARKGDRQGGGPGSSLLQPWQQEAEEAKTTEPRPVTVFGKLYAGELVGAAGPWRVALNDDLAVGPLSDHAVSQWRGALPIFFFFYVLGLGFIASR